MNSIRTRMTLIFSAVISLLMLIACAALIRYAYGAAEEQARTVLRGVAQKVQDDLTDDEHQVPVSDLVPEERPILRANNMVLAVFDRQGRVLSRSGPDIPAWPHPTARRWRVARLSADSATIVLGLPWEPYERGVRHLAQLLFTLGLFIVSAATLGAWLLVGRTLSPIGALARQAQAASAANLQLRLTAPSRDAEIVGLVSTLNGLLSRIGETVAARGRFHAAASHELRTPLQALSGYLELALNRQRSNQEYQELIVEANVYAQRLTSLTQDLLLLHQLDATRPTARMEIDLAELCDRMLRLLAPLARERGLQVRSDLPNEALLETAPTHADMLIRNLLENALKYATANGVVTLHLALLPEYIRLDITNDCAPLIPWEPTRLFEAFYRPDAARHSGTGGTGLGLAICKAIADASGWTLTLHQEDSGIRATVLFPYLV